MTTLSNTSTMQTDVYLTQSPNGKIAHTIYLEDGKLFHQISCGSTQVLMPSPLGLRTTESDFSDGLSFVSSSTRSWNNTYSLPSCKKNICIDNPIERTYIVNKGLEQLTILIRVYNDGVAFRYYLPGSGGTFIEEEYSAYNLPTGIGGWGQPWIVNYETHIRYYYTGTAVENLAMPFLASYNNLVWGLFTEANLINSNATYCPSVLRGNIGGNLKLVHAPDPDQLELGNRIQVALPFQSPWRVIVITETLNELVNSTLVQNVNPPSKITDTSWIKPGRVAWSWWSTYSFTEDDTLSPESIQRKMTYEQQREYVDFAAQMGWEYVTVDAGWVYWKDGTVEELCTYASTKGIGIVLWASYDLWSPYGSSLMNIKTWSEWGIAGLKIDIIEKDSQIGMAFMEEMVSYCASLGLLISLHSSTKPGGEERTWPNLITTEGVSGNEHYWLYWPPANTAEHNCGLPFTRNVIGSMDYTPVALSNRNKNTSQGHQLAQSVVFESGLQHFADSIDVYAVWKGTEFLRVVQANWDETKVLESFPGSYVTFARRKGSDWCIGAMTTSPKSAVIHLADLNLEQGDYTAYIYKDGSSADFLTKDVLTVNSVSTLSIPMLKNGGCAIYISKTIVPSMPIDTYTHFEAENAILVGSAVIGDCANCSTGKKVGGLGYTGEIVFTVSVPRTDIFKVRIYYLAGDPRSLSCSINGGAGYDLNIAYGSGSWNTVRIFPTTMSLTEGNNTIRLYHSNWAPDIDKIGILI